MVDQSNLEIPEAARRLAEQSVRQAREAYDQFVEILRKAKDQMSGSSDGAAAESARLIQERAMRNVEQNMQAGFDFAAALAKARDVNEYMEVYQRHAQSQMASYVSQAQELSRMMADLSKK